MYVLFQCHQQVLTHNFSLSKSIGEWATFLFITVIITATSLTHTRAVMTTSATFIQAFFLCHGLVYIHLSYFTILGLLEDQAKRLLYMNVSSHSCHPGLLKGRSQTLHITLEGTFTGLQMQHDTINGLEMNSWNNIFVCCIRAASNK